MTELLQAQSKSHLTLWAGLGAVLVSALLFALIPWTQYVSNVAPPDITIREVQIAAPPPKAPPPPEPPEEQVQTSIQVIHDSQTTPISPDLLQLDISLDTNIDGAVALATSSPNLNLEGDVVDQIQQVFSFEDLPEAPHLLNRPTFNWPDDLTRRKILTGRIVVDISIGPNGRAKLLRIVSVSAPGLEEPAMQIIRQARFSPPVIDGQAVTVRGRWPLSISSPNR